MLFSRFIHFQDAFYRRYFRFYQRFYDFFFRVIVKAWGLAFQKEIGYTGSRVGLGFGKGGQG